MGNWRITIEGLGCHGNNNRDIDADLAAEDFVDELQAQGHQLSKAKIEMMNPSTGEIYAENPSNVDFLVNKTKNTINIKT